MSKHAPARTHWSRYGFAWVTGALFVVSIAATGRSRGKPSSTRAGNTASVRRLPTS
jgi:hypothetical protein